MIKTPMMLVMMVMMEGDGERKCHVLLLMRWWLFLSCVANVPVALCWKLR